MGNSSYFEVLKWASSFLNPFGKEAYEAEYLLLERLGWSKTDWVTKLRTEMPIAEIEQFKADLNLLIQDVPAQYIIGSCEFYGQRFNVTPATLIPRPETEELVALCLANNRQDQPLKVIDIGTGSGAIALSLKKQAPLWEVAAVDISSEALAVAQENATKLDLRVTFYQGDLLEPVLGEHFDIIISNPPYIGVNEWSEMDESVRTYEPKLALFAENQGLALYQRLAEQAPAVIKSTGKIYLEIGYQQGIAVSQLFASAFPTKKVQVKQDLFKQDRMIEIV